MPQPGSLRCNSHLHASTSGRAPVECRAGTPAQRQHALHRASDASARRPQRDTQRKQQGLQDVPAAMQVQRRGQTIAAAPGLAERAPAEAQQQLFRSQESWQRSERPATQASGRDQVKSGSPRRQAELQDSAAAAPRQPQQQRSAKRPRPDGDQPAAAAGAQAGAGVQAGLPGPAAASSLRPAGAPAVLRGVVHRVTYKSADTGYTVLKVKPRSVQVRMFGPLAAGQHPLAQQWLAVLLAEWCFQSPPWQGQGLSLTSSRAVCR